MTNVEVEVLSQGSVRGDCAFACVATGFSSATIVSIENFKLRLDLEKIRSKEKNFGKLLFFLIFGLEKITKKKKYEGKLGGKIVRNK